MDAIQAARFALLLQDMLQEQLTEKPNRVKRTEDGSGNPVFKVGGMRFEVQYGGDEDWVYGTLLLHSSTLVPDQTIRLNRNGRIDEPMRGAIHDFFNDHNIAFRSQSV